MFSKKFKNFCKQKFWKKKKEPSAGRKLLENAEMVLRFFAAPDEPEPSPLQEESGAEEELNPSPFVHVGFANFKQWTMFFHLLDVRANSKREPGRLKLQSHILTQGDLVDSDCRDVFFTDLEFFRSQLDLTLPYYVEGYTVLSQPARGSVQDIMKPEDMLLGYVDVRFNTDIGPTRIWQGAVEETRVAKAEPRKQQKPSTKKASNTKKKSGDDQMENTDDIDFFAIDGSDPADTFQDAVVESETERALDGDSGSSRGPESIRGTESGSDFGNEDDDDCPADHKSQSSFSEDDMGLSGDIDEGHLDAVRHCNFDAIFSDSEKEPADLQEQQQQQQQDQELQNLRQQQQQDDNPKKSDCSSSSSDSDSSSSSSSSDSDDSSSDPQPNKLALPRAPATTEIAIEIVGYGFLRYNSTSNFLRAHCHHPSHGKVCFRRRSVEANPHRSGQGRPIGLLISWLKSGGNYDSQKKHVAASVASYPHRAAARNWFHSLTNASEFESKERKCEPGESQEPNTIP